MGKPIYLMLIVSALTSMFSAYAQVNTISLDLQDKRHVPLYDCSIYSDYSDTADCRMLTRNKDFSFMDVGYAVNCNEFRADRKYNVCLDLSASITFNRRAFDCRSQRGLRQMECETTEEAYIRGEFRGFRARPTIVTERSTTTSSTIVESTPVYETTCDTQIYDRSYSRWSSQKQKQYNQGRTRATVGIAATIGGLIMGQSRNSTVRNIGTGVAVGGVFLTAWGLIEMADADYYPPHRFPACRSTYVGEERRVIVEERECVSTRYTGRGRHSSHTYYEVTCENKSYVTYDRFEPWENGRY
ncbi:MAG TPA: hypothetical protein VNJ01_11335 [Bacteriovoracaceae bacterium]|nr:hypothetical protein [Bacteriovoracaceae bacterium]